MKSAASVRLSLGCMLAASALVYSFRAVVMCSVLSLSLMYWLNCCVVRLSAIVLV